MPILTDLLSSNRRVQALLYILEIQFADCAIAPERREPGKFTSTVCILHYNLQSVNIKWPSMCILDDN